MCSTLRDGVSWLWLVAGDSPGPKFLALIWGFVVSGDTRRDGDGSGTRRDDAGLGTRRDDGAPVQMSRVLPVAVAARYEVCAEFATVGSEADVFRVIEAGSGVERVLKLYRRGILPDVDAVRALQMADLRPHVVEVVDIGESEGVWFEVLEWCEWGSLRDLTRNGTRPNIVEVIRELSDALESVHAAGLVHRDVKPENVLVRTLQPLDLVLGDFGLVRALEASVRWTKAWGSVAYAPPEMDAGEVSSAWDWWSLGMLVAEHATGHHPFEIDGRMMSDQQVRGSLAQRPVDLSTITDSRVKLLCTGLLTRDRHHRWGHEQITAWLNGGTPAITADTPVVAPGRTRTVRWNGIEHTNPTELAAALQADWDHAQQALYQERDHVLVRDIEQLCAQHHLDGATRELDTTVRNPADIPLHLARLLIELDPDLQPIYHGVTLTQHGLEQAALAVVNNPTTNQTAIRSLDEIRRNNVLTLWRHLPGLEHGPATHDLWTTHLNELENNLQPLKPHYTPTAQEWATTRALLLLITLNPQHHAPTLTQHLTTSNTTPAQQQSWWSQLSTTTPAQQLTKHLTQPTATQQTHTQQEQAKAQHAAETQRQQAAERQRRTDQDRQQKTIALEQLDRRRSKLPARIRPIGFWGLLHPILLIVTTWIPSFGFAILYEKLGFFDGRDRVIAAYVTAFLFWPMVFLVCLMVKSRRVAKYRRFTEEMDSIRRLIPQ